MKYAGVGIVAIAVVLALYWNTNTISKNQYDDSYLSFKYSINLADHGTMRYNLSDKPMMPGSPLYVTVLAVCYKLGLHNLELVSCALNIIALGTIAAFVFLALGGSWLALGMSIVAALHGFISGWAVMAMDTVPFASLLLVFSYYTFVREHRAISIVLLILICTMRIEGVLMVVPWLMMNFWRKKHVLALLLSLVLFYCFNLYYYGELMPASYYAKKYLAYYHSQPQYLIHLWLTFASAPVIIFLASMFTGSFWDSKLKYLAVYIGLSGMVCLMGPSDNWARYSVHLLPLMCLFTPFVLKRKSESAIVIVLFALQAWSTTTWMCANASALAPVQSARREVALWMNANLDKNQWVLSTDFAEIGYVAKEFQFLDMSGLVTDEVRKCYEHGQNIQSVIDKYKPAYLVDTMNMVDGKLVYGGLADKSAGNSVKPLEIGKFTPLLVKPAGGTRVICVGKLER